MASPETVSGTESIELVHFYHFYVSSSGLKITSSNKDKTHPLYFVKSTIGNESTSRYIIYSGEDPHRTSPLTNISYAKEGYATYTTINITFFTPAVSPFETETTLTLHRLATPVGPHASWTFLSPTLNKELTWHDWRTLRTQDAKTLAEIKDPRFFWKKIAKVCYDGLVARRDELGLSAQEVAEGQGKKKVEWREESARERAFMLEIVATSTDD